MAGLVGNVVKVVRGRKVPIGTVGNCFWSGYGKYGTRVGLQTAGGDKYFTAASNVEVQQPLEKAPKGALLWSKKEQVGEVKQTSYYDVSVYKVPVLGEIDLSQIYDALRKRFPYRTDLGAAGGYTTVERVEKVPNENAVEVALYYHIGD